MQKYNFVFTLNNYTQDELVIARTTPPVPPIRWIGFEEEVGDSGTPHLQGAIVLLKKLTVKGVKKLPLFKRAHVEVMGGRIEQSEVYCDKEAKFESYGDKPMDQKTKGECNVQRYEDAYAAATVSNFELIPKDLLVRHLGAFHAIGRSHQEMPPARDHLTNFWIYGPPGTGKSQSARDEYGSRLFVKDAATKWWDGYNPLVHDVVLIDDIAGKHAYQMSHLKIWSDHNGFPAEIKNGQICIRPTIIIVTSNHSLDVVFADPKEAADVDIEALKRRFTIVDMNTTPATVTKPPPIIKSKIRTNEVRAILQNTILPVDASQPLRKKVKITHVNKIIYSSHSDSPQEKPLTKLDNFVTAECNMYNPNNKIY